MINECNPTAPVITCPVLEVLNQELARLHSFIDASSSYHSEPIRAEKMKAVEQRAKIQDALIKALLVSGSAIVYCREIPNA